MSGFGSTAVMGSYDFHHPAFPMPSVPSTPDSGRRTRSGRTTVLSTHSPARITKSTSRTTRNPSPSRNRSSSRAPSRSRSRATPLKSKPSIIASRAPQITMPLSILTADSPVPVRDIHAWVNRSAAIRQQEAQSRNGYVTRPMNSFMLYRSAYAERTKYWGTENNHQVVSTIAGQSWPLEPKEIREMYEEYARTERDNHAAAHPGYKFSPSKVGPVARARMRAEGRDDSDDGEVNDADSDVPSEDEYRPSRRGRASGRNRTSSPSRNGRGRSRMAADNRTSTPTGNNRNGMGAPMTPPSQVAHPYHHGYDGSPHQPQVAPFQLPQSWMVTTHDNAYDSSPNVRAQHGQQPFLGDAGSNDDYSSYNFDHNQDMAGGGYGAMQQQQQQQHEQEQALLQARAQYQAMQLAQQMQEPAGMLQYQHQHQHQHQQDGSSYTFGSGTQAQQPYYDYDASHHNNNAATGLSSLPDPTYLHQQQQQQQQQRDPFLSTSQQRDPFLTTSQQNLHHSLQTNLHRPNTSHHQHAQSQPQPQHSLYPPIDTIPRQYHSAGADDGLGLNLSYHSHHSAQQDRMLDPALLDFGASGGGGGGIGEHGEHGFDGVHGFNVSQSGHEQHAFGTSLGVESHHQQASRWGESFGDVGQRTDIGHAGGNGEEGDSLWGGAFD